MSRLHRCFLLVLPIAVAGCASPEAEHALLAAADRYATIDDDTYVLRSDPRDVQRAGETLAQAERFNSYWGGSEDALHYAYLSQRYSEIARLHSELALTHERIERQERTLERLNFALRESSLLSAQQGLSLEEQMIGLAASETERGLVMTLGDVLFDTAQTRLNPTASRTLLKLVKFLQLNGQRRVRIEGYTDSQGKAATNLALSRERAQAVADYLVDLGIDPARLDVAGYGERFPVAENASSQGRAQNRRVEIVFSDAQGHLEAPRE